MGEQPTESLWVEIKEQTSVGDIVVAACYRPPDQEERVDEAAYRQLEATSRSQTLVFMGNFSHPGKCWCDNRAAHKQSGRFLESIDDNFLTQVTAKPTTRGALLDLALTTKEGLSGDVKVKGSLGHSDHETAELRVLRTKIKITALDLNRLWPL